MNKTRKIALAVLSVSAAWPGLIAQTTTPPASAAKDTSDEELVVLTPFEISTAKDTGYQATQTLAGTRIRTDLKDVGSAISVITKDFLVDVGATDSATLLQYTTNAEVAGTRGTYAGLGNGTSVDETSTLRSPEGAQRVRGLASADNTRDFFVTDIPWDSYNVDRIDIQRGPNSILFGLGSPAGIVNASTHNADFRNFGDVSARTGSYGSMRSSIDINQQLVPGVLALRVDSMISDEKYEQKPAYQNDKRLYGAIRFDPKLFGPSFHTSIKAKFEHGDISANRPRIIPPRDSITPWFRNADPDPSYLFGGMGKTAIQNGYVSNGIAIGSNPNAVSPWLTGDGIANQQQPIWFMDGTTNQLYNIYGGYINTGSRTNVVGAAPGGTGNSLSAQRYSSEFFGLNSFSSYATNAKLKDAQYGQYRDMTLTDKTVFDFYHNLIDGPTKSEFEKWNAYNLDLTETAFDDRIGVELSVDRQKYKNGGQAYLNNPTINIDILQAFQDLSVNPNFGRAYVTGGAGGGSSYQSDRKYSRGSLFGELRTSDFIKNDFLAKLLGKHRFNGVYGDEVLRAENRSWQMYANSQAWDGFWNQNTGATNGFSNRAPVGVIYLGQSLANRSSASGANIPGITAPIALQDGNVYLFESTWKNNPVNVNDPWTTPTPNTIVFNSANLPAAQNGVFMQNSNPANYVGWNTNHTMNLVRDNNDTNPALTTKANITERETKSLAGTWQGFMWNNAIVPTLGWRYDEVESKTVSALPITGERGAYNLSGDAYYATPTTTAAAAVPGYILPDGPISAAEAAGTRRNQTYSMVKNHSTSGGLVVHINELFPKDVLPIGITLAYNKSNNFQVTNGRYDIYGKALDNPTGTTKEYSILLSTKDGKYSFRAIKYETALAKSTLNVDLSSLFGNPIVQGLKFRNVLLYKLTGYTPDTGPQAGSAPNSVGQRWFWAQSWVNSAGRTVANYATTAAQAPAGSTFETPEQAATHLDNTIQAWNDIQAHFQALGYFKFWGYTPTDTSALNTYSGYWGTSDYTATSYPAGKAPTSATVYSYSYPSGGPLGFTVTNDSVSKGYEFELTANPLPNWRVSLNASETTAVRNNVGDSQLADYISYMDTQMAGYAGDMRQFNGDYAAGNEVRQNWANYRASYTLLKLQEGASASELRKWRYNVVSNYSFTHGFLKGTGVGAAYRWQDKVVIGYPVIANGTQASFDLSKPYYGPAEDALDLWLSYERKLTDKLNWKIQLNIRNVLKKDGLIPISVEADGHTWASARIKPVQEWFLTNTFSF